MAMRTTALAILLTLLAHGHASATELWVVKKDDCIPCEEFRTRVLPEYRAAEERDDRLPHLVVKDVDRDRRDLWAPAIRRLWYGTPNFILVEDDGRARAIFPDFVSPRDFIEDVTQETE
jgi:hypothetical protein